MTPTTLQCAGTPPPAATSVAVKICVLAIGSPVSFAQLSLGDPLPAPAAGDAARRSPRTPSSPANSSAPCRIVGAQPPKSPLRLSPNARLLRPHRGPPRQLPAAWARGTRPYSRSVMVTLVGAPYQDGRLRVNTLSPQSRDPVVKSLQLLDASAHAGIFGAARLREAGLSEQLSRWAVKRSPRSQRDGRCRADSGRS